MPRQNRVTPFSTLIATSARGTFTGNRGCLHDGHEQIRRQFQGKRWIICLLDFKGRRRSIMTPGHYTELFFLDEATALTAGHRPCAECQRERFKLFREIWAKANLEIAGTSRPTASTLDAILHQERIATHRQTHRFCHSIEHLPDGTFVTDDEHIAYLVLRNQLLRWRPFGYEHPPVRIIRYPVRVLTPASVVCTLAAGYPVSIHSSAFQGAEQIQ
ncbi:hypothetical protein GobsU_03584 [Candidatus Vecturithrix granuli]|uniref:Ada DNA repair metal-binding domain-containing protein n=1 Tax=Vecturithrix granuli TaxID=1499967 RepID=A0A081BXD3_VECG1|nr:hypothetical protein GobsU_03584 [Candidatus Vecturithrix granuli]